MLRVLSGIARRAAASKGLGPCAGRACSDRIEARAATAGTRGSSTLALYERVSRCLDGAGVEAYPRALLDGAALGEQPVQLSCDRMPVLDDPDQLALARREDVRASCPSCRSSFQESLRAVFYALFYVALARGCVPPKASRSRS